MEFIKWMDNLPRIAKILLAIFISPIYTVYMIIRDINIHKGIVLAIVLDAVFGLPLGVVNWVLNIIFIIKDDKPVDYVDLFNLSSDTGAASSETKKEEAVDVEVEEKKEEEAK